MEETGSRPAAEGRARGIIVGSLIALGWWVFGASIFARSIRPAAVAAAVALTAALFIAAVRLLQRVRTMQPAAAPEIAANKRVWRWFWLNLIGEIILLNVTISLLGDPELRVYWIPAISGVVGLHFLPMAIFFRTRSYWPVGIAMMVGATIAVLAITQFGAWAVDIAHIEALANAVILWSSLGLAALSHRLPKSGAA